MIKLYLNKLRGKRVKKTVFIFLLVLFIAIFIAFSVLLAYSKGEPKPFLDENGKTLSGSVSEKVFVNIGGVNQGMFIRGKNINNPVLLFVHGGPCFPEYFLFEKYPTGLEDIFTVCYWEQRGGGLSYSKDVKLDSINFEQFVADSIEVTNYLRGRFNQDKIYLMAHSGGTAFAIQTVAKAPELYNAYIGIAQITRQAESEKLAYKYMIQQYITDKNKKMVDKLKQYPVLNSDEFIIPFYKSSVRDNSMHQLGIGTMRNIKSVFKDIFLAVWACNAYTIEEKTNLWYAKFSFIKKTKIINELFATDITAKVPKLDIPVYFFSGAYDLTVNNELAKSYLSQLQAPVKGFYTFSNSAHSPIFEEPQKVIFIMQNDVLNAENKLADII